MASGVAGIERVILIVLDGVGCGALPDAEAYGDPGSDTLAHVSKHFPSLRLPNLARWGIGNLSPMPTVPALNPSECNASFGRCREISNGKDTTSGHWEMAGVVVKKAFATFPNGFEATIVDRWVRENNLPGILGNYAASGTEIIKNLGEEHIRTGKPILYTSADSVWQIAAHEEAFGLEKLYAISKSARKICDELNISRVIARPFTGKSANDFKRTHHRKDFAMPPYAKTMMEFVADAGYRTVGVGKIWNIYNGRGIQDSLETIDNTDGLKTTLEALDRYPTGLIFVNLIDFDMNYGHRRDIPGFARALEEFDKFIPEFEAKLTEKDLVIVSADHGNDPSYRGTDHTREHVPLLVYNKGTSARRLGDRETMADIGQTICHALCRSPDRLTVGKSFLHELQSS